MLGTSFIKYKIDDKSEIFLFYIDNSIWIEINDVSLLLDISVEEVHSFADEIQSKMNDNTFGIRYENKNDIEKTFLNHVLILEIASFARISNLHDMRRILNSYWFMYKDLEVNDEELRSCVYDDCATEICSLEDFIRNINDLTASDDPIGPKLFFRGQEVNYWQINPSIFRGNMLSQESALMIEPLRRNPRDFINMTSNLDVFQKYQHYGMCTRLLDVTENPLVALYFACLPHGKEWFIVDGEPEKKEPNGVIFYRIDNSPLLPSDYRVSILLELSRYNFDEDDSIGAILKYLLDRNIIKKEQFDRWSQKDGIGEFISIIQGTYLVMPVMNNERLSRQSGAFLLPGKYNVNLYSDEVVQWKIEKAYCSLRNEFNSRYFFVGGENKEKILKELNQYGINEARLFPELEHQLKYIRSEYGNNTKSVSSFEKYNEHFNSRDNNSFDNVKISIKQIEEVVNGYGLRNDIADAIINVFNENNVTDWFKRESILSKIRISISKILLKDKNDRQEAERKASEILNKVLS